MALFLSKYENKIDKKGRVSVPARFRSVLMEKGFSTVILLPTIDGDAITACGMDVMLQMQESMGPYDPYSAEQDSDMGALMTDSHELPIDGDGRIVVPLELLEKAGITDRCVFAGRGRDFQLWEPEAFDANMDVMRARARVKKAQKSKTVQGA